MSKAAKVQKIKPEAKQAKAESFIQVPVKHLRAMLPLSGNGDVRYYLNGLYIEASATETRVAATDGHVFGVLRYIGENQIADGGIASLIIPRSIVQLLGFAAKDAVLILRSVDMRWDIVHDDTSIGFKAIDAIFPNFRAILPKEKPSMKPAQFNPDLLMKFRAAGKLLSCSKYQTPVIHYNGETSAATVTIPSVEDFVGVIMPIKHDVTDAVVKSASWARNPLTSDADAKKVAA